MLNIKTHRQAKIMLDLLEFEEKQKMGQAQARKRKVLTMATVVCYRPRQQEYLLLPVQVGALNDMIAQAQAQYSEKEKKELHVVCVLEGIVRTHSVWEENLTRLTEEA
jgi:hypothetical protein